MGTLIRLLVLVLTVPLVGFIVSSSVRAQFNRQLHSEIRRARPDLPAASVRGITIDRFCQVAASDAPDACAEYSQVRLVRLGSAGVAVAGILLLLAIWAAGRMASSSRTMLLRVFRPGLYVVSTALIVLVAVHAAIAIATFFYAESALFGIVHFGVIATIGVGAAGGVLIIGKYTFGFVKN